jgi:hypothetical protein
MSELPTLARCDDCGTDFTPVHDPAECPHCHNFVASPDTQGRPVKFTDAQIRALIPLRNGAFAQSPTRSRTGGARRRMFDRLVSEGICTGPPFYLTETGLKQLGDVVTGMTSQQRAKVGIYQTNGVGTKPC